MIFKATLDKLSKVITIMFCLVFFFIGILPFFTEDATPNLLRFLLGLLFAVIVVVSYYFSVKSYEITKNEIVINRPFDKVLINKSTLKEVVELQSINIYTSIRTFGSGGVFGYYGKFWNKQFGIMRWYATRTDNVIVIITIDNKKIMVSPDEHKHFFDELSKEIATN